METSRHIPLAGAVNFRDVGGYPTDDGRRVAWRRLFRADSLNRLTPDDHALIRRLGVATVVDLRSTAEVEEGRFDIEATPVDFHHLPFMESVPDPEAFVAMPGLLASTYVDMIEEAGDKVAAAIEVLADADRLPAIVHCTAGKDRTGVLVTMVLGLLGVSRELIIEDYALSARAMDALRSRLTERYPDFAEQIAGVASDAVFSAAPANIEHLLDAIDERYGSIEAAATAIGVSGATQERLRGALTTD